MKNPVHVLAEPYTAQELADFECMVLGSSDPDTAIRLVARAQLGLFFEAHGRAKCDLMMARLGKWHDQPQRPDA